MDDITNEKLPIIEYSKDGGLAGYMEKLTVYGDGSIKTEGKFWKTNIDKLQTEKLDKILDLFEDKGFFSMNSQYHPEGTVYDGFHYILSYQSQDKNKTVDVIDFGKPPKEFWEITSKLEELLKE